MTATLGLEAILLRVISEPLTLLAVGPSQASTQAQVDRHDEELDRLSPNQLEPEWKDHQLPLVHGGPQAWRTLSGAFQ